MDDHTTGGAIQVLDLGRFAITQTGRRGAIVPGLPDVELGAALIRTSTGDHAGTIDRIVRTRFSDLAPADAWACGFGGTDSLRDSVKSGFDVELGDDDAVTIVGFTVEVVADPAPAEDKGEAADPATPFDLGGGEPAAAPA